MGLGIRVKGKFQNFGNLSLDTERCYICIHRKAEYGGLCLRSQYSEAEAVALSNVGNALSSRPVWATE